MAAHHHHTVRQTPPPPRRRLALRFALTLLLVAVVRAADVPSGASSLAPEASAQQIDTVAGGSSRLWTISANAGTNPAIKVTLTPQLNGGSGDVDLYCLRGIAMDPGPGNADFESEAIGVNQDVVVIPPIDSYDPGSPPAYTCAAYNRGFSPVTYKIQKTFIFNDTGLIPAERAVAQQLFDRCCQGESCRQWQLASDRAAKEAKAKGEQVAAGTVDTDLCQFGTCEGGRLVQFNARDFSMSCPFPGDLFVQFAKLQFLYLSYNDFTGDINEVAANLTALPELQELGLMNNQLTGALAEGGSVCLLAQGTVEMLQISGMGLTGQLPACLFTDNSTLYQFGAANNQLTGAIPDAFAAADRLQVLNLGNNKLSDGIPASLAAAPKLTVLDLSNNSLSGAIPELASAQLTVVNLASNKLTGGVPNSLAAHPTLNTLDLRDNSLTSLPSRWLQAPAPGVAAPLNYLRVALNRVEGGYPSGLASYPNLTYLLLEGNRLSGALPDPQAGQYPSLRYFYAGNNALTGVVGEVWHATGIWQLPALSRGPDLWNVFSVANNQLSGIVPAALTAANQKVLLELDGNQFSAPAPTGSETAPAPSGGSDTANAGESSGGGGGGGLSTGAVAGICVAIVLGTVAVAVAGFMFVRRRSRRAPNSAASGVKFDRFLDEALDEPSAFYEAAPVPASPPPAARAGSHAVELSGSPGNV